MIISNISCAASGLALLLFALRFLTDSLDREFGRFLGSGLQRVSKNSWSALLFGVATTLMVQASSVTVITTMGFLSRGILTLDRSILIMLGAAVGSTLKGWYGAHTNLVLGPLLLLAGALGLVSVRDQRRKRMFGVAVAIGITFLGLQLIETGLAPIAQTRLARDLLEISVDGGMFSILKTIVFGFFLTVILQSSSSVLLLVISFSSQGLISVPAAIGVLLGANVGTTITPLIASIGHDNADVKRLALGYCLVKALAVALVLTYFRTHTTLLEDLSQLFNLDKRPDIVIVGFHTWFNMMIALTWWLFLPVLVRGLTKLVPGKESPQGTSPFTLRIQRLLGSLPGRALSEGINKLQQVIRDLHWVSDSLFHLVQHSENQEEHSQILDEALRKCERSVDVLDSVRDVAWRYLQSSENSCELRKKVLGLIILTADLKNIEVILHSCIQTLSLNGISPILESNAIRSRFLEIRERLNQSWEKLFSLDSYNENAKHLDPDTYGKDEADAYLFEIAVRLNSVQRMMEGSGGLGLLCSNTDKVPRKINPDPYNISLPSSTLEVM